MNLELSSSTVAAGDDLVVTVPVTNTGDRAGSEVVQCYVAPPPGELFRPAKELKAFGKIRLDPARDRATSRCVLTGRSFAHWDPGTGETTALRARMPLGSMINKAAGPDLPPALADRSGLLCAPHRTVVGRHRLVHGRDGDAIGSEEPRRTDSATRSSERSVALFAGRLAAHAEHGPGHGLQSVFADGCPAGLTQTEAALVDQGQGATNGGGGDVQAVGQLVVGAVLDHLGHVVAGPLAETGALAAGRGRPPALGQFRFDLGQMLGKDLSVVFGRHGHPSRSPETGELSAQVPQAAGGIAVERSR